MNDQILNNTQAEDPTTTIKKTYEKPSIISEHELEIHAGSPLSDTINPFDEALK
jgi:hypothetical protein